VPVSTVQALVQPLVPVAVLVQQQVVAGPRHVALVPQGSTRPPLVLPDAPVAQLVSIHQQPGRLLQTPVSTVPLVLTVALQGLPLVPLVLLASLATVVLLVVW
jgi:hypothetical protein